MNKKIVLTFAAFSLAFTACGGFNPNSRYVQFVNGQAYKIPYGVRYAQPHTSKGATMLEILNNAGVTCNDSDVIWMQASIVKDATLDQIAELYSQGKIGCSSPLSDQELQYTMHEENLAQQRSSEANQDRRHLEMLNQQQHNEFMRQQQRQIDRFIYGY